MDSRNNEMQADSLSSFHSQSQQYKDSLDETNPHNANDDEDQTMASDSDSSTSTSTESLIERSKKYMDSEAGIIILKRHKNRSNSNKKQSDNYDITVNFDIENSEYQATSTTAAATSTTTSSNTTSTTKHHRRTSRKQSTLEASETETQTSTNTQYKSNLDYIDQVIQQASRIDNVSEKNEFYKKNIDQLSSGENVVIVDKSDDGSLSNDEGKLVMYLTEKQLIQILKQRAVIVPKDDDTHILRNSKNLDNITLLRAIHDNENESTNKKVTKSGDFAGSSTIDDVVDHKYGNMVIYNIDSKNTKQETNQYESINTNTNEDTLSTKYISIVNKNQNNLEHVIQDANNTSRILTETVYNIQANSLDQPYYSSTVYSNIAGATIITSPENINYTSLDDNNRQEETTEMQFNLRDNEETKVTQYEKSASEHEQKYQIETSHTPASQRSAHTLTQDEDNGDEFNEDEYQANEFIKNKFDTPATKSTVSENTFDLPRSLEVVENFLNVLKVNTDSENNNINWLPVAEHFIESNLINDIPKLEKFINKLRVESTPEETISKLQTYLSSAGQYSENSMMRESYYNEGSWSQSSVADYEQIEGGLRILDNYLQTIRDPSQARLYDLRASLTSNSIQKLKSLSTGLMLDDQTASRLDLFVNRLERIAHYDDMTDSATSVFADDKETLEILDNLVKTYRNQIQPQMEQVYYEEASLNDPQAITVLNELVTKLKTESVGSQTDEQVVSGTEEQITTSVIDNFITNLKRTSPQVSELSKQQTIHQQVQENTSQSAKLITDREALEVLDSLVRKLTQKSQTQVATNDAVIATTNTITNESTQIQNNYDLNTQVVHSFVQSIKEHKQVDQQQKTLTREHLEILDKLVRSIRARRLREQTLKQQQQQQPQVKNDFDAVRLINSLVADLKKQLQAHQPVRPAKVPSNKAAIEVLNALCTKLKSILQHLSQSSQNKISKTTTSTIEEQTASEVKPQIKTKQIRKEVKYSFVDTKYEPKTRVYETRDNLKTTKVINDIKIEQSSGNIIKSTFDSNAKIVQIHPLLKKNTKLTKSSSNDSTISNDIIRLPETKEAVIIDSSSYDDYIKTIQTHFGGLKIIDFPVYLQELEMKTVKDDFSSYISKMNTF